jgi:hypothetical protein
VAERPVVLPPVNRLVAGSNPAQGAKHINSLKGANRPLKYAGVPLGYQASNGNVAANTTYLSKKRSRPLLTTDGGTLRTVSDARVYMLALASNGNARPNCSLPRPTSALSVQIASVCPLSADFVAEVAEEGGRLCLGAEHELDLEGDYADDRQRDQSDLTLTSHMGQTAEVAVRRAWPTCAGSERLLPA